MTISFTINQTDYHVDADGTQYTLYRHGINQKVGSDNLGKDTEIPIGYYSQVKNAVARAVQDELGNQPDEITLGEFIERYEASNSSVMAQIGDK